MRVWSFSLVLMFSFFSLQAQDEKSVDSKITNVTVFLSRAQVTREARIRLDPGKTNLILKGLTSQLDPQSIQVSGKGSFTILGISHQQNYLNEMNLPKSLKQLKDSVEYAQRSISLINSEKEILQKEEQLLASNQKIGGSSQSLTAAELKSMADFYRARMTEIVTSKMKSDQKLRTWNERLVKWQRQYNEENDLYSRNTSEIIISVSSEASSSAELSVNYIVTNAGWNPVYDLRAVNTKSPVQLNYKANVFQSTGEEWKNVRLKLSTANPTLGGLKPELSTLYLDFYRQPSYSRKYRAAAPSVAKSEAPGTQYERLEEVVITEAPAALVSDYVSTVQTTLNTEFDIALPYTVASASKPTLVDIRNHELKADYKYATVPKLDNDAFLLASILGWEQFSLLPGEANVFFEGTFVGKSFLDPNSIRDTLAVSLGRDKRIVVKREKLKDFSSRKLIGTNQKESRAFEISVRNTKSEPIKILLEDQIPVSQNGQIEVTVGDVGGAKFNKVSGKLSWELELQPNETKKVVYRYEVKYPKDQIIVGLD